MAQEKGVKPHVPNLLRVPLEAVQVRLVAFEEEVRRAFEELSRKSEQGRSELTSLVSRLLQGDWQMKEVRDWIAALPGQGQEYLAELCALGEALQLAATKQLERLRAKAAAFMGVATLHEVEELSHELTRLARRFDHARRRSPHGKRTERSAVRA